PVFPDREAERQRSPRHPQTDSSPRSGRGLARHRGPRQRTRETPNWQGSRHAIAHLETAIRRAPGDGLVPRRHRAPKSRGRENQEFLHEVASGAAKTSTARDDRTLDHAAVARVSENRRRSFHAAVGWQATLANGVDEVPETTRATAASTSATTAARTRRKSGRRCRTSCACTASRKTCGKKER